MPKTRREIAREVDEILRSGSGGRTVIPSTDPALWTTRSAFGVAGGPIEVVLTDEGDSRAFSVGAQVRRGGPAEALEALWIAGGEGHLTVRGDGARLKRTELGRFDQIAWGHLKSLGLVVSFQDHLGDGVRLTDAGRRAAQGGDEERTRLLARCRSAFAREAALKVTSEPGRPRRRPR